MLIFSRTGYTPEQKLALSKLSPCILLIAQELADESNENAENQTILLNIRGRGVSEIHEPVP